MKNCSHQVQRTVEVEDYEWCKWEEDHVPVTRLETRTETTFEDIDTHRMKCSRCGKIEYYSKSAKDHYENGIPSPWVIGMNKKK